MKLQARVAQRKLNVYEKSYDLVVSEDDDNDDQSLTASPEAHVVRLRRAGSRLCVYPEQSAKTTVSVPVLDPMAELWTRMRRAAALPLTDMIIQLTHERMQEKA